MSTRRELIGTTDRRASASRDLAVARAHVEAAVIDPAVEPYRRDILDFIATHDDALDRSCVPGHLTGSAVVMSADGRHGILLFHKKLQRWLQPGGHCDGDANLPAVALREAIEETGIDGLAVHPIAVDVDIHEVNPPREEPHLHLDVRYVVVAPPGCEGAPPPGNHESEAIVWVDLDSDLERTHGLDPGTLRMLRAARRVLVALGTP